MAPKRWEDPDPWKRHAISLDWKRDLVVDGRKVHTELEPACWTTGCRLGIIVGAGRLGSATYRSRRLFDRAEKKDLDALVKRIRFGPCTHPGCRTPRLLDSDWPPAKYRTELCERHRLAAIGAKYAPERERLAKEEAAWDAKRKALGHRWKAIVWIHHNNRDDEAVWLTYRKRPTKAQLAKVARRHHSALMGDWSVRKL